MTEIEKSKDTAESMKAPQTELEEQNIVLTNELPNDQPLAKLNTTGSNKKINFSL